MGEDPMIYTDTLYLPSDNTFSDADIEAMKQQRYQNWLNLVSAQSLIETPVDQTDTGTDTPIDKTDPAGE